MQIPFGFRAKLVRDGHKNRASQEKTRYSVHFNGKMGGPDRSTGIHKFPGPCPLCP